MRASAQTRGFFEVVIRHDALERLGQDWAATLPRPISANRGIGDGLPPEAKQPQVSETAPSPRLREFLEVNPWNDYCVLARFASPPDERCGLGARDKSHRGAENGRNGDCHQSASHHDPRNQTRSRKRIGWLYPIFRSLHFHHGLLGARHAVPVIQSRCMLRDPIANHHPN